MPRRAGTHARQSLQTARDHGCAVPQSAAINAYNCLKSKKTPQKRQATHWPFLRMRIAPPPRMRAARPAGLPAALPDWVRARDRRAAGSRGGVLLGRRRPVGARRREGGEPASPGRRGRLRGRAASPFPPQGAARTGPRRRRPRDGGVRRRHLAVSTGRGGRRGAGQGWGGGWAAEAQAACGARGAP